MDVINLNMLYKYYGQLEFLGLRFPIDEKNIRILFTWYCAFTNTAISQYSLAYEKACVMFNIAATLSTIGTTRDRSKEDEIKKAYHYFQSSAGIFEFINTNFLHAPSFDLEKDNIQSLCEIMLAQAQEVLCEKQINESKKPSIIYKLCAQTAWYYENIISKISKNVQKKIFKKYWLQLCEIKQKYYSSIAHLNKALVDEENNKYGEALAHLAIASTQSREASKLSLSLLLSISTSDKQNFDPMSYFNNIIKNLSMQIQEKKNKLNHDNDYIYYQSIVSEESLKPLERLSMAKATPIQEIYVNQNIQELIGQDIFYKFIPISIHESVSLYSEEKAKLIRKELERCETADLELDITLSHLKLPDSLKQYKYNDSIIIKELSRVPEEIIELSKSILDQERDCKVSSLINSLLNLKEKINIDLNEIEFIMNEEEQECETMREKYLHKWSQIPSSSLTLLMKKQLSLYRESLSSYANLHSQLISEYNSFAHQIATLIEGEKNIEKNYEQEIKKAIQSSQTNLLDLDDSSDIQNEVNKIEDMLKKLNIIKRERQTTLKDLKEKICDDDISNILILKKAKPDTEKQIFLSELEKFKLHETRLSETIYHQAQILRNLTLDFENLQSISSKSPIIQKWTKITETNTNVSNNFKGTYKKYFDIRSRILDMISSYKELKSLSSLLLLNTKKFVDDRRHEGANILFHIKATS
ncbi:hypothetical protein T552_03443 [Pneumocystis carinii B80]|uniref:BRO domain-containing protein 1 n=1 Tax=Pneumocystis carinii (strain B80) TaxID=1408658 RepID=A0A0W4ZBE2_PNEC8|nr:hypothetical protein T552_03443 [Pneumocystis carinii B80]KTW25582.1 hypothetical protein T552_03443 [Pneumocystis carinii B80]